MRKERISTVVTSLLFLCGRLVASSSLLQRPYDGGRVLEATEQDEDTNLTIIICIVLCLIGITVLFEGIRFRLEENCRDAENKLILEKLFGELTVLGFLAMVIFFIHAGGILSTIAASAETDEHKLVEYIESVHFTLFSIMIFFVIQVLVLIRSASYTQQQWNYQDKLCRDDSIALARSCDDDWIPITANEQEALDGLRRAAWYTRFVPQLSNRRFEKVRDTVIFRALRTEFLLERSMEPPFQPISTSVRLPSDFYFGRYLALAQSRILAHVVEVQNEVWFCFAVATIFFYMVAGVVKEDLLILAWFWVGMGWFVYLFNIGFESHLIRLRDAFLPKRVLNALYHDKNFNYRDLDEEKYISLGGEEPDRLPSWCDVDLDNYIRWERSWLTRTVVGGQPNRQQTLFWMDRHGPHLYLIILQANLIFVGVYMGLSLLTFVPTILNSCSIGVLILYIVLTALPVIGITYNKRRLVATLTEVCSIGSYRKVQIIGDVLRHQKTFTVVRTFLIIYKLHQFAQEEESMEGSPSLHASLDTSGRTVLSNSERTEIERTFVALDTDGDGTLTHEELKELLSRLDISANQQTTARIINVLDQDGDGVITRQEFLDWYSSQLGDTLSVHDLAQHMFDWFDTNNNKEITIGEFKEKLDALSMKSFTLDEISGLVHELDRDKNGTINSHEFEDFLKRYSPEEMNK